MTDKRISEYDEITTPADTAFIEIVADPGGSPTTLQNFKWTWANLKATLKTYFDTLYAASADYLSKAGNLAGLADTGTARTNLGLGNVENTALSTWAGTTNITTVGNVTGVALALARGTITTALSPLAITETRNASGVTFPGLTYTVTNTASHADSKLLRFGTTGGNQFDVYAGKGIAYGVDDTSGFAFNLETGVTWSFGRPSWGAVGVPVFQWQSNGNNLAARGNVSFGTTFATRDIAVGRNAAGVLEINNGTAGQYRDLIVRDITAASNLLLGSGADANLSRYAASAIAVGNGTAANTSGKVVLGTVQGLSNLFLAFNGNLQFQYNGSNNVIYIESSSGGTLKWNADNTVDIGASGATRPRTIYAGTSVVAPRFDLGGDPGAVTSRTEINKAIASIADATATAVFTVTIPNAAHSASIKVKLTGSLGAGGVIGANESTQVAEYEINITRTAGLNAVATIGAVIGQPAAASVVGAATAAVTGDLGAISGAIGASNTFTIRVTIARSVGLSTNHTCVATASLLNANATGISIA